jgi:bifunctional non-homologous end joining protein LigD
MRMAKELEEYNQKRNFKRTGEPEGKPEGKQEKPEERLKFVVQHHIARRDHFDFRLEWEGALLSWAVPKGPSCNTRDKRLAVQVEDHPLEYRNFEGTIPKGEYGGGIVMLWDEGYWEPQADVEEGLREGSLKFVLKGRRLKGKWALIRMKAKAGEAEKAGKTENNWLLLKEKDEYAKTADGISEFTTSVRTGRTMTEIEEGNDEKIKFMRNPFHKINVQLAKLVNTVPEGEDWLYELKYDGYRILAYLEGNNVRLITRNGNDYTKQYQDVAYSLANWAAGRAMVLDGEMVITDAAGKSDFQALQNYMRNPGGKNLTYIVFDLLALDGTDFRGRRLIDRKSTLDTLMKDSPENIHYSKHIRGNGKAGFLAACEANLEGVIGKKADSVYSGTRNGDWIKLKCDTRQEFVIGGYTLSDKKASGASSLLLGVYDGKELVYAGRAGTGLSAQSVNELVNKFESIKREAPPFRRAPESKKNEKITWLEPVLVAEIKFTQWTEDNLLRQASFKGLRTDKDPGDIKKETIEDELQTDETQSDEIQKDVKPKGETPIKETPIKETPTKETPTKETPKGETPAKVKSKEKQSSHKNSEGSVKGKGDSIIIDGIKITSPDKVMFEDPEIKKADVVRYYAKVSERMMPYVGNRILSIVRCPNGISESCFFKKHPGPGSKRIVTIPIVTNSGDKEEYFYAENASGLLSEAQMGTLEFHIWGSRVEDPEKPDMMVFDLDPDEGMDLEKVRQGVKDTKNILDQLSLISYLKTSGGKGYHVVVPLKPSVGWEPFHDFARHIAEIMEQKWPERYTSNVRKDKRKNKIFIDWIRNGRGATSIAPYSIRAREGAPVSMPITWKELDTVTPDGVNMSDALMRLGGYDPWKDFYQIDQRLK